MKDLAFLKNTYICHRGLHSRDNKVVENTLLSFDKAIEKGYSIELDTNILKDGTIVVFHDRNLLRLAGINIALKDLTYEELISYKLKNTSERIPKLSEVLKHIDKRVPLLIELKPFGEKKKHVKNILKILKNYEGKFALHTFNPYILYQIKKQDKTIPRGQITEYFKDTNINPIAKYLMKTMTFNFITKPDFITYGIQDLPNKYVKKSKRKGIVILSYVARTQSEFDFVKSNYDNAVFEFFTPIKP